MFAEHNKNVAEESLKIQKARKKLKKQIDAQEKKVTEQALREKKREIAQWIERHVANRIVLKAKSISLFDENQNPVAMSEKVQEIARTLKNELKK